ncbi:hypothetical protein SDC9_120613 [bioreactor metagenome]|uniref:Uncharacterized protein n=1 Tax=bioreactor metagenome TaxID=1076179 RepID=A0A645C8D8_9ZZZZ
MGYWNTRYATGGNRLRLGIQLVDPDVIIQGIGLLEVVGITHDDLAGGLVQNPAGCHKVASIIIHRGKLSAVFHGIKPTAGRGEIEQLAESDSISFSVIPYLNERADGNSLPGVFYCQKVDVGLLHREARQGLLPRSCKHFNAEAVPFHGGL